MTYAPNHRSFYDADSHVMELPNFIEDVGMLIDTSHPELYLFSSDYPHVEGTSDTIGRFERFLTDYDETIKDQFYSENFLRLSPNARV